MRSLLNIFLIYLIIFLSKTSFGGDTNWSTVSRAKTLSLNGLYFAGVDGIQSSLGNPSMLALLNSRGLEVFVSDQFGQHSFENNQNEKFKSLNDDDFGFGGGFFWSFSSSLSTAVSYQRAIDYKIDWPFAHLFSNDSTSSLFAFKYSNELTIDAAAASIAIRFEKLSVGATAYFYYVECNIAFPRTNERWNEGMGVAAYQFDYQIDGNTYGFNLGASYQLSDEVRIGVMTRSGFSADLEGTAVSKMFSQIDSAASEVNLSNTVEMPWIIGGGIIYNWSENLKVNVDLQYNLWSGIQKTIDLQFNDQLWQQRLSSIDSLTGLRGTSFNIQFENSLDAGIGFEYQTPDILIRASYRFMQSPNSEITYNLLFPSVDRHRFSLGIEYQDQNLLFDAGVAYSFGISRDVSKAALQSVNGNYNSQILTPVITIKYLL